MKILEYLGSYEKYRWFFTSTGKLVIGGKSSTQNDELLKRLKRLNDEHTIMHTSSPGSPFTVILAKESDISQKDLEQTAIFTGSFSRAWRSGKKKAIVDIFKLSQLYKSKFMKAGTWGVKGKIERKSVELQLTLTKQKGKLRAVPEQTIKSKKDALLKIRPGKIDKSIMLPKLQVELHESFSQEDLLSALPAGGVAIVRSA